MNCNNISYDEISSKNTQKKFEWAITYMARGEDGTGLSPVKFETAMEYAREWKRNLVKFLIGKPIRGNEKESHTQETAIACADAIFKFRYAQEVRAFEMPTISNYWTREAGPIEFGELEVDKMGRLEAEDQPIFVLPRAWTSKKNQIKNYGQLLSYLVQGKSGTIVLRNARAMAKNFAITWSQYNDLRMHAGELPAIIRKVEMDATQINI